MTFQEQLNNWLAQLSAAHKDLAEASGLSEATISRYCSGGRSPAYGSRQLEQIARGLRKLADAREESRLSSAGSGDVTHADEEGTITFLSYEEILEILHATVQDGLQVEYDVFLGNLNHLLKTLDIRTSELSRGIYVDPSHVSRILSGSRRPGNLQNFIRETTSFLARRCANDPERSTIARLLDTDPAELSSAGMFRDAIVRWLGSASAAQQDDSIPRFLTQVDAFDLNDYLKAVRFDEIKLPPTAPHLPTRKEYTGIARMMESEIEFMKTTVLSRSDESCILYSDMPLEEMAADPEFPKKYMFGMAMMLKKGLHLHNIHDINRPFGEMMLGLESWIPLYMTGQISPYYLPAAQNGVFLHFLKVSGAAALEGTAIAGNQGSGKYVLYRSKEAVKHYRQRAEQLLSKARPLMNIYRREQQNEWRGVMRSLREAGDRKIICSHLPTYFLPQEMLQPFLRRHGIAPDRQKQITAYYTRAREAFLSCLEDYRIRLVLPFPEREAFASHPVCLSLADLFMEEQLSFTFEEYRSCIDALEELSEKLPHLSMEKDASPAFQNINITILGEKAVIVSKEKSPAIHFVIHHKKMVRAFRSFIPPIVET